MEYERMREKPQGGGVSPRKLRSMLLGVEKKRSGEEEEELESSSEAHQVDNGGGGGGGIDDCKDVDVVTVDRPECSTSLTSASGGNLSERKMADNLKGNSSIRKTLEAIGFLSLQTLPPLSKNPRWRRRVGQALLLAQPLPHHHSHLFHLQPPQIWAEATLFWPPTTTTSTTISPQTRPQPRSVVVLCRESASRTVTVAKEA